MSIIRANLKHYSPFQNRSISYYYSLLLISVGYYLYNALSNNRINNAISHNQTYFPEYDDSLLIFMYYISIIILRIQLDILSKPFSFCLPYHRFIPRKIIIIMGIIASLVFALVIHLTNPLGPCSIIYIPTIILLGFSICLFVSYLSVRFNSVSQQTAIFVFGMGPVFLFGMFSDMFWEFIGSSVESFIFFYTMPLIISSTILFLILWKKLGHPDLHRKSVFNYNYSTFNVRENTILQSKLIEKKMLKSLPEIDFGKNPIEIYFSKIIKRLPFFSLKQSIIGSFYCMMDRYYELDKNYFKIPIPIKIIIQSILLFFIVLIALNSKQGPGPFTDFFLFFILLFPCISITTIFGPVFHSFLLPVTRVYHFKKSYILWLIKPIAVIIWFCIIALLAWILTYIFHDFILTGNDLNHISFLLSSITWIMVLIPVIDTLSYYFENPFSPALSLTIAIVLLLSLCVFGVITDDPGFRLLLNLSAALLANGFFIYRLARYWMYQDITLLS
jgi:hypothetical protein